MLAAEAILVIPKITGHRELILWLLDLTKRLVAIEMTIRPQGSDVDLDLL